MDIIQRTTQGLPTDKLIEMFLAIANKLAGSRLYDYQERFARRLFLAVIDRQAEELTALWCRQSGKSQTLAACSGALMLLMPELAVMYPEDDRFCLVDESSGVTHSYKAGFLVGVYAPKKDQASIIFTRMKKFFSSDDSKEILREIGIEYDVANGQTIEWSNGSRILCSTASVNSNIEGQTHHIIIMDEAQDIADKVVLKSISPMAASTGGTQVKIGTANYVKSHYYSGIQRNKRIEAQGGSVNHYEVNYLEAQSSNKLYAQYVAKEKGRLGESSDEFQLAYMVKFMLHRGMAITEEVFKSRGVISGDYSSVLDHPNMGMGYACGVDFGKVHDSTVVTILEVDWNNPVEIISGYSEDEGAFEIPLYAKHVVGWLEMQGDDYASQIARIKTFLSGWNVERMSLDYTGVGIGLGDHMLAAFPHIDINFVTYTPQSKDVLARMLLSDMNRGILTWPAGAYVRDSSEWLNFRVQLLDLEKTYKNGLMALNHPDVRGARDDYFDSLSLGVDACSCRPFDTQVVETAGSLFH